MDLERIKQNLRLRSGRKSKTKKAPRSEAPKPQEIAAPNGVVPTPTKPDQQSPPHITKGEEGEKEAEPDKSFDIEQDTQTKSQQESDHTPPQAVAGSEDDHSGNTTPRQYGRSGITVPHQSQNSRETPSPQQTMADPQAQNAEMSDANDFDLKAPAPKPKPPSVESLSELLFSAGHLNSILHDPREIARFTAFLNKYKPDYQPLILRFLETQKAIKAIEYANAVAEGATVAADEADKAVENVVPSVAATLDKTFEEASTTSFTALVGTALPMYVTYCLTKLVTECLVNEITGKQTSLMQNLVGGLSEVFCLTDPNQEDNPIIYASEEFYRYTGYGSDDVIGNNCRFLQGRKTNPASPQRLREHITKGEGICETLLNYRRDGRPFINLLLVAPLHDDKGKVKYFIGAQVDVTGLVENGRGLDAFERYLTYRQFEDESKSTVDADTQRKKKALKKLRELSEMFDLEESAVVQTASRASSMSRNSDAGSASSSGRRSNRRVLGEDDEDSEQEEAPDEDDKDAWKLGSAGFSGLSGKLPGIYETFMLIRPAPSLRIIFVSPKLRKIGKVVQSPFLSHVAATATTLEGLKESFTTGTPVLAKINFLPQAGESRDGVKTDSGHRHEDGGHGRACWISATPLVGSDDRIGVWMIVVVEKNKAKRTAKVAEVEAKAISKVQANKPDRIEMPKRQYSNRGRPDAPKPAKEEMPIKPKRLDESKEEFNGDTQLPLQKTNQGDKDGDSPNLQQTNKTETSTDPATPQHVSRKEDDKGSTTPLNAEKHAACENEVSDDDEFVFPRPPSRQESSRDRVRVQSDSVGEPDPEEQNDWHPTRSRSNTQDHQPDDRKYTPPPEIPESMVGATPPSHTPGESQRELEDSHAVTENDEDGEQELDATPTRPRSDQKDYVQDPEHVVSTGSEMSDEDGDKHHTPTHQHGPDGVRQSSLLAMDYLRHPGSRLTPTKQKRGGTEEDTWTDPDCLMSPYSVD